MECGIRAGIRRTLKYGNFYADRRAEESFGMPIVKQSKKMKYVQKLFAIVGALALILRKN